MFDFVLPFDLFIAKCADGLRSACGSVLTPVFKAITLSGNSGLIFIIAAIILTVFKPTRKLGVTALIALIFGALFTNVILKRVIARERPFADTSSQFFYFWKAAGGLQEGEYSFPSGHATASTAFGFALFLVANKKYSWLFLFIPLIMGFTRVYFVVHYASDILGGFVVGIIAATIAYFIVRALMKNKKTAKLF